MINVFLCDDDPAVLAKYEQIIRELSRKNHIQTLVQTFRQGQQILFRFDENPDAADILYLDIIMKSMNGIDIARKLREDGCTSEIIFLTANEEYVFESFEVSPLNYLIKGDTSAKKFEKTFLKAVRLIEERKIESFFCARGSVKRRFPIKDILYFEVDNRIVTIHSREEQFSFYSSMKELEKSPLLKKFVRIHRSYLVHLKYIKKMEKDQLLMENGDVLPMSRTYSQEVKQAFSSYLRSYL